MNRNPSNTAVFILANYGYPQHGIYSDNLAKLIKNLQDLGLEPYLVTTHEELLELGNLFICPKGDCSLLQLITPYLRDFNLILNDYVSFDSNDLAKLLQIEDKFRCLVAKGFRSAGFAFYKGDEIERLFSFMRDNPGELDLSRLLLIIPDSKILSLPNDHIAVTATNKGEACTISI